jgi:hypothetical protein
MMFADFDLLILTRVLIIAERVKNKKKNRKKNEKARIDRERRDQEEE